MPHESSREFRRRMEKQENLLQRLELEWRRARSNPNEAMLIELEQMLFKSARVGLDRIRRMEEAEILVRRRREKRKRFS